MGSEVFFKSCQEYLDIPVPDIDGVFRRNITSNVQEIVTKSGFNEGLVIIHTFHTTIGLTADVRAAGLMVQEDEPLLMQDIESVLEAGAKKCLDLLPMMLKTRPRILDVLPQDAAETVLNAVVALLKPVEGFKHDDFDIRTVNMGVNERKNAEAHLKASMIKEFLFWTFKNGCLNLGKWQDIIFWDFDPKGRRMRRLNVALLGI